MKYTALSFASLFLLTGCLVDSMEKITKDTRDEVRATKEGAQMATALEVCLAPEISTSARVAACKPVLLKLPEDRLGDYMGLPLRILKETSVKRALEGAEIDLPNVLYVGEKQDLDFSLELAPTAPELHDVLRMAVTQAISDIGLKAMQPGVSGDDMATYREYGRRLVFVGTAILGAAQLKDLTGALAGLNRDVASGALAATNFQTRANRSASSLPKIVPLKERAKAAEALQSLARNLSQTEDEIRTLDRLSEVRLGIR